MFIFYHKHDSKQYEHCVRKLCLALQKHLKYADKQERLNKIQIS